MRRSAGNSTRGPASCRWPGTLLFSGCEGLCRAIHTRQVFRIKLSNIYNPEHLLLTFKIKPLLFPPPLHTDDISTRLYNVPREKQPESCEVLACVPLREPELCSRGGPCSSARPGGSGAEGGGGRSSWRGWRKGQECLWSTNLEPLLSLFLPISTTPLFICFLIGAKPVKCCRTELEVICSYLCLPELGDEVECSWGVCVFTWCLL